MAMAVPAMLLDQCTIKRRAARTTTVYIHCPIEPLQVRTTRAYRRTTLCNSRAHSFAQLPEHQTGRALSRNKNCGNMAAHNASQ